ncbi:hypothetical protein [Malonomonas rubra]|uniref:hypothetical protein n=1 Tax=Malonomonas rubra TaxID=57040 RepID=UPI0026ED7546|nr:hypothetical protein [Malonomonas rubra]
MQKQQPPHCALCGAPLNEQELEQCHQQAERFNGQLLCFAHQRRFSGCPGLRNQGLH